LRMRFAAVHCEVAQLLMHQGMLCCIRSWHRARMDTGLRNHFASRKVSVFVRQLPDRLMFGRRPWRSAFSQRRCWGVLRTSSFPEHGKIDSNAKGATDRGEWSSNGERNGFGGKNQIARVYGLFGSLFSCFMDDVRRAVRGSRQVTLADIQPSGPYDHLEAVVSEARV
jgi:hypothetical protein